MSAEPASVRTYWVRRQRRGFADASRRCKDRNWTNGRERHRSRLWIDRISVDVAVAAAADDDDVVVVVAAAAAAGAVQKANSFLGVRHASFDAELAADAAVAISEARHSPVAVVVAAVADAPVAVFAEAVFAFVVVAAVVAAAAAP